MSKFHCLVTLSCLLSAVLLIGLVPQNPPTLVTATVTEGIVQFRDAHGRIVEPLLFKRTVPLDSEVTGPAEVRLVEPKGTGTLACAYIGGYLVWAEGQMWGSPSGPTGDEAEETGDVTVASWGYITGSAVAYNCRERQEPHSEEQPKLSFVREPPRYLPPKRESRLFPNQPPRTDRHCTF